MWEESLKVCIFLEVEGKRTPPDNQCPGLDSNSCRLTPGSVPGGGVLVGFVVEEVSPKHRLVSKHFGFYHHVSQQLCCTVSGAEPRQVISPHV